MTTVQIASPRLELILQTPDEVLAWVESLPPADRVEVSPAWIERVRVTPAGDFWSLNFSVRERAGGPEVGGCAFKGPPDGDQTVEIAYGIEEPYRGRGYATEAARALTDFALATGKVRVVRAHTRPGNGASATVLTRCGFQEVGEVIDPEDGLVCRWERREPAAG